MPVALPAAPHLQEDELVEQVKEADGYGTAAFQLAWLQRVQTGHTIDVACLSVGTTRILHLPGELFVEYQLAAKEMRPDLHVAMAAYGDYGPGYIGTASAYDAGGYETSRRASYVAPEAESILMNVMKRLLE